MIERARAGSLFRAGLLLVGACLMAVGLRTWADTETDWLELMEGYAGKVIGARVEKIEPVDGTENQRVTLAIPKAAIADTQTIDEIVVVGKRPKKEAASPPLKIDFEWAKDYERDYYGLIITLGKETNYPIRLYFKANDDLSNPQYIELK